MFYNIFKKFVIAGVPCGIAADCVYDNEVIYHVVVGNDYNDIASSYKQFAISDAKKIASDFIKGRSLVKSAGEFHNRPHFKASPTITVDKRFKMRVFTEALTDAGADAFPVDQDILIFWPNGGVSAVDTTKHRVDLKESILTAAIFQASLNSSQFLKLANALDDAENYLLKF